MSRAAKPRETVDRPIFIIGSGRCGSTILHQTLSRHPCVAYLSTACASHPASLWRNRMIMRLVDSPILGDYVRRKFPANEQWPFWNWHFRGFCRPCRDLLAGDVRPNEAARMQSVLGGVLGGRRQRLLIKLTGWPRIGYLARIFPDARFIHLVRDGRAVVNSLLNVDFWQGWSGPDHWGWGNLTAAEEAEWQRSGKSFVVLAAIQWKRHVDAFELAKQRHPPFQCLELRYEDFVTRPLVELQRITEFCQLEPSSDFNAHAASAAIDSRNHKWREQLTQEQQRLLENSLREHLLRYGYDVDGSRWAETEAAPEYCGNVNG